jgi:hypothetical protein
MANCMVTMVKTIVTIQLAISSVLAETIVTIQLATNSVLAKP